MTRASVPAFLLCAMLGATLGAAGTGCGEAEFVLHEPDGPLGEVPVEPTFTNVAALLRTATPEFSCATDCHVGDNPTNGIAFDGDDATLYQEIVSGGVRGSAVATSAGQVATSTLLLMPLAETDGTDSHPKEPFPSESAPGYRLISDWIAAGAAFD